MNKVGIWIVVLFVMTSCGANSLPSSDLNETFPVLKPGPHNMKFSHIPSGVFQMGSPEDEIGREESSGNFEPQHWVRLTKDYWMQTTEVTRGQWFAVLKSYPDNNGKCILREKIIKEDDYPVSCVSISDVNRFIKELNRQEKGDKYKYRLPTEAEWEFATRGYTETAYSIKGKLKSFAWYLKSSNRQPHPVAKLKANKFGLHDTHGNVYELTSSFAYDYPTADSVNQAIKDPFELTSSDEFKNQMIRGGSWAERAPFIRSAARMGFLRGLRVAVVGLRLVRTVHE